tara:strand:+ start:538 stop:735 length:198 start_codon:yes stop_codon:yes gene_type:complete
LYHYAKFKHKYWQWDLEDCVTSEEKQVKLRKIVEEALGIKVKNSKQVLRLLNVYQDMRERGLTSA